VIVDYGPSGPETGQPPCNRRTRGCL